MGRVHLIRLISMARKRKQTTIPKRSLWQRLWSGTRQTIRENLKEHEPWEEWVDAVVATVLTLLCTWLALHSSFTGDLFNTITDTDSPELIDLYNSSSRRTGVPKYSSITIMPIDGCSRQEVTTALELLSDMETTAIGMDVVFPYYADGDEMLVEAIMSNGNIVLASCPSPSTYFEPMLADEGVTFGSVVLDVKTRHDVVRTFAPAVYTPTDTVWSFEMQLARMAGAGVSTFYPYDEPRYILYSNLLMDTLSCKDLIDPNADLEALSARLKGQIVLMGDMTATSDLYRTPIDADMPGVLIHAYALEMMLRGNNVTVSSKYFNWSVACVLCFVFSFFMLFFKWGFDDGEGLALRITQVLLLVLLVVVPGVCFFHWFHWYFDFTPALFALAIHAFVLDVWVGIMALAKHVYNCIHLDQ